MNEEMKLINEEKINELKTILLNEKYSSLEDTKNIYYLISYYQEISKINDYEEIEKKLYDRFDVKSNFDKILYELKRITVFITRNSDKKDLSLEIMNYYRQVVNGVEILNTIPDESSDSKKSVEEEIIYDIINLEMELGMKIGLYSEFFDYFNERSSEIITSAQSKGLNNVKY